MSREPVITGGHRLPDAPPPPQPAQRPGCFPSCCGVLGSGNGGHHPGDYASPSCAFRPNRAFDHLDAEQDEFLSVTAHRMRRSSWWFAWVGRVEQRYTLEPIAGELNQ